MKFALVVANRGHHNYMFQTLLATSHSKTDFGQNLVDALDGIFSQLRL